MAVPGGVDAVWFALSVFFGVGFLWATLKSVAQSWRVLTTPRSDANAVTEGPARLRGVARPLDERLEAPLTGRDCVLVEWQIQEATMTGPHGTKLADGYDAVPFRLEDGTGVVEVRVDGEARLFDLDIELDEDWDPVFEVPYGEQRPDRALDLEDRADVHGWGGYGQSLSKAAGSARYYYECPVEPGDEVTVYGTVTEVNGRPTVEPGKGSFVVARGDLARPLRFRTVVFLLAAVFFLGASWVWAFGWAVP